MADENNKKISPLEAAQAAELERLSQEEALAEAAAAAEQEEQVKQQERQRKSSQNLDIDRLKRQYENLKKLGPERRNKPVEKQSIKPTARPTAAPKTGVPSPGSSTAKATQAGSKLAGQTAKAAGQAAVRIGAQVARLIAQAVAQLATRVAAFLFSNPYGWVVLAVIVIVIVILIGLVVLGIIGKALRGEGGREQIDTPTYVVEESIVKSLKALAGDLKAGTEITEEKTDEILESLDEIKTRIEKTNRDNKGDILAQIETTRSAVEKLRGAVIRSRGETERIAKSNTAKVPKYVLEARDTALAKIDKLIELVTKLSCSNITQTTGLVKLSGGTGYDFYDIEEMRYASPKLACFIQKVAEEWHRRHPELGDRPLSFGDASNQFGGNSGRHKTHLNGTAIDLWGVGIVLEGVIQKPYQQALAREFAQLLWDYGAYDVIFNDPTLNKEEYEGVPYDPVYGKYLTRSVPGHANHWHVEVR